MILLNTLPYNPFVRLPPLLRRLYTRDGTVKKV